VSLGVMNINNKFQIPNNKNESLSKKDFVMRIKIARKEAKENRYWLRNQYGGWVRVK
jgi:hypothetical protein